MNGTKVMSGSVFGLPSDSPAWIAVLGARSV
jgi:hypothetical protein